MPTELSEEAHAFDMTYLIVEDFEIQIDCFFAAPVLNTESIEASTVLHLPDETYRMTLLLLLMQIPFAVFTCIDFESDRRVSDFLQTPVFR